MTRIYERRVLPSQARQVNADVQALSASLQSEDPLNLGDTGEAVSALQRHLRAAGTYTGPVSGTFDAATEAALQAFQQARGLTATGALDADTFEAARRVNVFVGDRFETPAREGQRGTDIAGAEQKLAKLGFLAPSRVDGIFDAATTRAIEQFRRADKQLGDKGQTIDRKVAQELATEARGFKLDPWRRRDVGSAREVRQHQRLEALTAGLAKKGEGIGRGAKGRAVLHIEHHLRAAGFELGAADQQFGARTEAAVREFQKAVGLRETGRVDEKTWNRLRGRLFAATSGTSPAQRLEERSGAVLRSEKLLKKLGLDPGRVDGLFDKDTLRASRRFEKTYKGVGQNGAIDAKQLRDMEAQANGVKLSELRRVMPNLPLSKARAYLPLLNRAMAEANIDTRKRQAMFLAQLAHESAELRYFEEIASGAAYEGREDLGNVHPGDGRRYKGRGPIQLTGRANYRAAGRALDLPLEKHPKMAARPSVGFRTAAWYWRTRGLNALADKGDFRGVTLRINGGYNGYADRVHYYRRALAALS